MKKVLSIIVFVLSAIICNGQEVSVFNGVLNFATVTDYEGIVEANESDKEIFFQTLSTFPDFTSLSQYPENNSLPDSIMEEATFMANILNQDGVVKIGSFFYKLNYFNQKVYVLNESLYTSHYSDLINSVASESVGQFDLDFDIIDMVESGILTQPTDEELNSESARIRICWRGARAKSDRDKRAMYFRDLSDPGSTFGSCINYYDGTAVASTRLKCKIEYLTLGIWCRLDVDAKIQKPGKLNINDIPLWTTCNYNVGEQKWTASFKAVFRGRCSDDVEQIYNPQNLNHPVSDEN